MVTLIRQILGDNDENSSPTRTSRGATTTATTSRKRPRRRGGNLRWSAVCALIAATTLSTIPASASAQKQFTTVVNGRCGRYARYVDWMDGLVLADCEERCANVLGCEEFGFKDGGPPRCSLFLPEEADVPQCVGLTDYDVIKSLDAVCMENEEINQDLDEASLLVYEMNVAPSPFQTPVPQSECIGQQVPVDGSVSSLGLCKLKCVIYSETVQAIDKKCGGVSYDESEKNCVLSIGISNGISLSESNSMCSILNYDPRASCRATAAATSACGNAYWMDMDGRCACLRVPLKITSSSFNSKIPTTPNSSSTGRSFTLLCASSLTEQLVPTDLEEMVLGLSSSAFAGILVSSIGSVLVFAATARHFQSKRIKEYAERSFVGRVPPFLKKKNSDGTEQSASTDLSSHDSSAAFGPTVPRDVPEDDVLDDDPFAPDDDFDAENATPYGSTRTLMSSKGSFIISGTKRMRESSAASITSLGAAFIQLMGLTFKDKTYRESRAMQCHCKRKRAVNYDDLNQAHLEHICRLRGINPNGPADSLVIKLFLFESDTKQAVCKQCLLAFPKRESGL